MDGQYYNSPSCHPVRPSQAANQTLLGSFYTILSHPSFLDPSRKMDLLLYASTSARYQAPWSIERNHRRRSRSCRCTRSPTFTCIYSNTPHLFLSYTHFTFFILYIFLFFYQTLCQHHPLLTFDRVEEVIRRNYSPYTYYKLWLQL